MDNIMFGYFHDNAFVRHLDPLQLRIDLFRELSIVELARADVDAEFEVGIPQALFDPLQQLLERGFDDPVADLDNLPRRLEHVEKIRGRYHALLRVLPANQRFRADDVALGVHQRLVKQAELVFFQRPA